MLIIYLLVMANAQATEEPYIVYSNGTFSERNLPLCGGPREACNIIRQRFWLPPIVHRLCKCPDLTDCPMNWVHALDKRTISINARAQLKFCSPIGELERCKEEHTTDAEIVPNSSISIHCFCGPGKFFQKLHKNATGEYFTCLPFTACENGDFCGHIAADSYETYHTCTCPAQHICILQNRRLVHAYEFLYKGLAYEGICTPREH